MARQQQPWNTREFLYNEFVVNQKSTSAIAKEQGTYPMTIRRALKKHGIEVRGKSEAQKINIAQNGSPLEGRRRPHDEKINISMGLQKRREEMSAEELKAEKKKKAKIGKESWEAKSDEERKKSIGNMRKGNRRRVGQGSKNENAIAELLSNVGYDVKQRNKDYTPGRRFEVDIALPQEKIAIEWDGPNHFDPIYGKEHLEKVQAKDKIKDEVLTRAGWTVIRVRDHSTASTMAFCRRTADKILEVLENAEPKTVYILDAE